MRKTKTRQFFLPGVPTVEQDEKPVRKGSIRKAKPLAPKTRKDPPALPADDDDDNLPLLRRRARITGSHHIMEMTGLTQIPVPLNGLNGDVGPRPRFTELVAFALVLAADRKGYVMDARRMIDLFLDGALRWPSRHEVREDRLVDLRKQVKETIEQAKRAKDQAFDLCRAAGMSKAEAKIKASIAWSQFNVPAAKKQLYLRELPPVRSNISRCFTWLEDTGLIGRDYVHPESGQVSGKVFRGAVVRVVLLGPLQEFRDRIASE